MIVGFTLADVRQGDRALAFTVEPGAAAVVVVLGIDGDEEHDVGAVVDADALATFCRTYLSLRNGR